MSNRRGFFVFALLMALFVTGCATHTERDYTDRTTRYYTPPRFVDSDEYRRSPDRPATDRTSWFNPELATGQPPRIEVRLGEQKAYFYRGDTVVGVSEISSGREGYRTPTGSYKITQKSADHRSNLYGDFVDSDGNVVRSNVSALRDTRPPGTTFRGAPMPHFLRFHGAYGLHGGHLPGYPASHGCIRLPLFMARHFYNNAPAGTPVIVRK